MPSKYGNHHAIVDNIRFDSKAEAARWTDLKLLMHAGKISALSRQVPFVLAPAVKFHDAKRVKPALRMVVDFEYYENGVRVLQDVKGAPPTEAWIIKRHLLKHIHGLDVEIIK